MQLFKIFQKLLYVILIPGLLSCTQRVPTGNSASPDRVVVEQQPNIVVIVVDDLSYNDLGLYGSEIRTPTIDALASNGLVFSNFYAAPTCSPTRAMLLTGVDSHIAGLGNMHENLAPNQRGKPGYEGFLNRQVAALPEIFQDAGYNTYMTGKWHLGLEPDNYPVARGFDRSYALLPGGAGAFANRLQIIGPNKAKYVEDDQLLEQLPEDFYSTRFYTEKMMEYIEQGRDSGRPFFAYLAYTAPHWPLQAPQASIARYRGMYDEGYEALQSSRLNALKDLAIVDDSAEPFPPRLDMRPWDSLSEQEQRYQSRIMEIYAAMVDDVDRYIGAFTRYLEAIGEYDNTLIFFMSDNGPEAHNLLESGEALRDYLAECCDNSYENLGNADSYVWIGPDWGRASNTPLRMYKGYTTEGGVRVPAFFHDPRADVKGVNSSIVSVQDIAPTLLAMAGIAAPEQVFRGRNVAPITGRSLVPILNGDEQSVRDDSDYLAWELIGKRAVRQGDWKIVYVPANPAHANTVPHYQPDQWQLYNIAEDPSEQNDLAAQYPQKLAQLTALWRHYAQINGVILPDEISYY